MTESAHSSQSVVAVEDGTEFRALVAREFNYVWNTLRRLGVRYDDLKDQTQEVFFTVHTLRADFDDSRPIRPWLFGIAYRVASRYRSLARNTRELLTDPDDVVDSRGGAVEELIARERQRLVLTAVESIDLPRRAIFIMSEIDEIPMPQVAEAMALPLNTAYSRLRLARKEFAAAVRRLQASGGAR